MNMVISDLRLRPVWKDLAIFLLSMPHGSHCGLPVYMIVLLNFLLHNLQLLQFRNNIVLNSFKFKSVFSIVFICPLLFAVASNAD